MDYTNQMPNSTKTSRIKVLVTGSAGFVGKVLVQELLINGYDVTGIDRIIPKNLNYRFHLFDMKEPFTLSPSTFDLVIHCAAAKGDWGISKREFYRDNVIATKNLVDYLEKCKVSRVIHFSTVAIYSRDVTDGSEDTKIEPYSSYGQTKLDSEILSRQYAGKSGIETVILRPSVIYGRDNYANMFNLIQQLSRSVPFQINPKGIIKSHVSVRNVVDVVLKFCDFSSLKENLEIYNLTERPYNNLNTMIEIICDELSVKPPKVNLPIWLVYILFGFLEIIGRIVKKDTGFTLERLQKFSSSTHYTSEKLWLRVGDQKYSSEEELRDMVNWFKHRIL